MKRVAALAVFFCLGACTSGDPGDVPSLPADPCALLSDQDVEATMGAPVIRSEPVPPEQMIVPGASICDYQTRGPYGTVVVAVEPEEMEGFVTVRDRDPRNNESIDNLGDEAFASGRVSVWVRVDEGYFVVGVQRNPGASAVGDLQRLAEVALESLPAWQ
jgi:hypothetical protein